MPSISSYETEVNDPNLVPIKPGHWDLISAKLSRSQSNKTANLNGKIAGIKIYENIYTPYLTGTLAILDTENLITNLPILGGEKLELKIKDCYNDERTLIFYITKVKDKETQSLSSITYTLEFSTKVFIENAMRKISKSYITKRGEDIIKDLLEAGKYDTSNYFWKDSHLTICCLIPNWRITHSIKWVSSRTVQDVSNLSTSPYTTFTDNENKTYTVPLDFLYSDATNKTKGELFLKWQRTNEEGHDSSLLSNQRMIKHQYTFLKGPVFLKTPDIIENLYLGMYSNQIQEINLFRRETTYHDYDYIGDFAESEHLGDDPIELDSNFTFDPKDKPMWRSIISSDGLFSQENHMTKIENRTSGHISKIQQTENIKMMGVIPGSYKVRVGQKYNINLPIQADASTKSEGLQENDKRYSGDYLISEIAHEFVANGNYSMTVKMFKDALSEG